MVRVSTPDVRICIPSYGRVDSIAKKSDKCTLTHISKKWLSRTKLYVEPEEMQEYKKACTGKGVEICDASRAETPKMWGSIMDYIMDSNISDGCDILVIMDDDLKLAVRPNLPEEPTIFTPMTPAYFEEMMQQFIQLTTKETPLVSAQYRQFCQGKINTLQHNQRISMIWSMNCNFFHNHPQFRFHKHSKLRFMDDYYFFLKLLTNGWPNICINKFVKDDKPNAPGGMYNKRKKGLFNTAVNQFADMFPDWVTVYEKTGKSSWEDGMLGVKIRAAQAYKHGSSKRRIK